MTVSEALAELEDILRRELAWWEGLNGSAFGPHFISGTRNGLQTALFKLSYLRAKLGIATDRDPLPLEEA